MIIKPIQLDSSVTLSYCIDKSMDNSPSIVSAQSVSIDITPSPEFFIVKDCHAIPTAVGKVTVNVPLVHSIQ